MEIQDRLDRLTKAIEYLKDNGKARNQEEIAEKLGGRQPHVSSALKGDPKRLTKGFLQKFARAYAEYISEEWLVNGIGDMKVPDASLKPNFDAKVAAGFMDPISKGEYDPALVKMIPWLADYDFTIQVSGDSMTPIIQNGDHLACRRIDNRLDIAIGEIYVFDTKDGALVKMLKNISEEEITLQSLNPEYHDLTISPDMILGVALVVGSVREFPAV